MFFILFFYRFEIIIFFASSTCIESCDMSNEIIQSVVAYDDN
jgi:hypothetical protein